MGGKLHWLTQRVNGWVGYLAGVENQMVPVDTLAFIIAHSGEEHAASLRLLDNIFDNLGTPVVVLPIVKRISADGYRLGRAEENTAVAANTILFTTSHLIVFDIIVVNVERALVDAHLTLDTPLRVSLY
jgi:hypothetical protein